MLDLDERQERQLREIPEHTVLYLRIFEQVSDAVYRQRRHSHSAKVEAELRRRTFTEAGTNDFLTTNHQYKYF